MAGVGVVGAADPADAAGPVLKHVSLAKTKVAAGKKFTVNYHAKHVPSGAKIQLQRQFGTGHVYKAVAKLPASMTSKKVKAPALGKYEYRVVITKNGALLAKSAPHMLYSYGVLPIHKVLHKHSGTRKVGGTLYRFDWSKRVSYTHTYRIRKQDSGSCRWIRFTAAMTTGIRKSGTVKLIQEDADMQQLPVQAGAITAPVKWTLTGHAFEWTYRIGADFNAQYGMLAGTMSCWSDNWKTS